MTISDLITLAESRLSTLNNAHATATRLGDINQLAAIDIDIEKTQSTLASLHTILEL